MFELGRTLADQAAEATDLRTARVEVREFASDADPAARAAAARVRQELLFSLSGRMRVLDPEVQLLRPSSFGPTHAVLGSVERDVEGVYVKLRMVELSSGTILVPLRARVPVRADLIAGDGVLEEPRPEPVALVPAPDGLARSAEPAPALGAQPAPALGAQSAPAAARGVRLADEAPASLVPAVPGPGQARLEAWKALFESR
ncbi:MAG: hypothetical protein AAFZ65_09375 [Planctomycetota bacterium]